MKYFDKAMEVFVLLMIVVSFALAGAITAKAIQPHDGDSKVINLLTQREDFIKRQTEDYVRSFSARYRVGESLRLTFPSDAATESKVRLMLVLKYVYELEFDVESDNAIFVHEKVTGVEKPVLRKGILL